MDPLITVRMHLWLETDGEMFFGAGRAMLLRKIEEHGSLQKAAKDLGMSYRAAWGKLKKTEKILGFALVERLGGNQGYRLNEFGRLITDIFTRWFAAVEADALRHADAIFPWHSQGFEAWQATRPASPQASPGAGDT